MTAVYGRQEGVPRFSCTELAGKTHGYALLIPVINEGGRLLRELERARAAGIPGAADIVLCDGGSGDGSTEEGRLAELGVNALLVKQDAGRQGAQLRMGIWWALRRGYAGIITIDGNDKDSIEDVPRFIEKLREGYDLVQGSRFVRGGRAVHTPPLRYWAVRLIHAPVISLTARHRFTDTTNAYRAYSARYLADPRVQPLRDVFMNYELLAYLSTRATQLGYRACEVPVTRAYPRAGRTPTKISFLRGNGDLLSTLLRNWRGEFIPREANTTV